MPNKSPNMASCSSGQPLITADPLVASQWLSQGKLLAYPTESVWGLGCDAMCESALDALIKLKQRDPNKGLIVLSADWAYLEDFVQLLDLAHRQHITKNTDNATQAITWLLPLPDSATHLPNQLTGGYHCLAVRVIIHPLIKQLCRLIAQHGDNPYGFLVSTSCNLSGKPPATSLEQAVAQFGTQVAYLTGDTLGFDKPSQIIDPQTGNVFR